MSEYEKIRNKNLADNRRILAELGLVNPFKPIGHVIKKVVKRKITPKPNTVQKAVDEPLANYGSIHGRRRKSARIQGRPADEIQDISDTEEKPEVVQKYVSRRPNEYGHLSEVEIGTVWGTRMECSRDGIHRPTVAGIHAGPEGAYSIALSGGYDDNIDLGECFTYTGEGGRDLKGTAAKPKNLRTAPQSKDQTLTRGNLALSKNCENGFPVRVIRGYKLNSPFAPEEGYRYDGIYTVEKFWYTTGLSGFGVWKFALRRCKDQALPPWQLMSENNMTEQKGDNSEEHVEDTSSIENDSNHGNCPDTNNNEKVADMEVD